MQVITYSDARGNLKAVMDRVVEDHDATIITRKNGSNAVLLSEAAYNRMMETMHLLANPANAAHLLRAVAQDRQGQAVRRELVQE